MLKFIEEKSWEGNAETLSKNAKSWIRAKPKVDPAFEPNESLVREYSAQGILSKPEPKGKEGIFSFEQLVQFLTCPQRDYHDCRYLSLASAILCAG